MSRCGVPENSQAGDEGSSPAERDAELTRLRDRVVELERALAAAGAAAEPRRAFDLREEQGLLQAIVDNSPAVIFVRDHEKRYLLINRRYEALFHVTWEQVRGKTDFDIFPRELAEHFSNHDAEVMDSGVATEVEEVVPTDDGPHTYITLKFPIYHRDGSIAGVGGIATDITDRKRAEHERAELQQQMLVAQEALVRELSTPLIPLASGVLAMPIIGMIDGRRAQQIMHTLLEGITRQRARVAILDITGVTGIDAEVADALVQVARAARMLGSEVVLTGIGPDAASALVEAGADLSGIVTVGTLQAGIAYGLKRPG